MRKINVIITGVALVCGVVGSAAAQRGGGMGQMGGGRGMGRVGGQNGGSAGAMMSRQLFRGITLTDAQKTQLQKVRDDGRTQMQAQAKAALANREAVRAARENGDTVALNNARLQARGDANKRIALRAQQEKNVRGLLTPEQQKTFDANRTRVRQRAERAATMMRRQHMGMRRQAMMRAMAPGGMRMQMQRGRGGFGPGGGMQMQRGRGGFGPDGGMQMRPGMGGQGQGPGMMQRGRGGPPPDTTGAGGR